MTLQGFHDPRSIMIHVEKDAQKNLWHYYDAKDQITPIEQHALTGVISGFYLKESKHEKTKNKSGVEKLKGNLNLNVSISSTRELYRYTLNAGLDSIFFRTLLISLAAVPDNILKNELTIEVFLSSSEFVNADLRNPSNGFRFIGQTYGKGWEGLDYPDLIYQTLIRLKSGKESYELMGFDYPENTSKTSINSNVAFKPKPKKEPGLYPQNLSISQSFREQLGVNKEQALFIVNNMFNGTYPDDLDPESFTRFLEQIAIASWNNGTLKPYYDDTLLMLNALRSKVAVLNNEGWQSWIDSLELPTNK